MVGAGNVFVVFGGNKFILEVCIVAEVSIAGQSKNISIFQQSLQSHSKRTKLFKDI